MKKPVVVLAMILALSGCFSKPAPTRNTYQLELTGLAGPGQVSAHKKYLMTVGQISVAAGFEGRSLIYRVGLNRFESDFYNELMAPPDRLLADLAVQYLEAKNPRFQVLKSPGIRLADFGLEGYIEKIYGDYYQNPPRAVVSVKFVVNDLRPATPKVALNKLYSSETPLSGTGPDVLAAGLSRSLEDILARLDADLAAVP